MLRRAWAPVLATLVVLAAMSAPATAATRHGPAARVTLHGDQLRLDGKPWRFTGVDAFGATTMWSVNWGCGSPVDDLDGLFSSLRPGSVVRTWAFQALAWNNKAATPHLDFTAIDRVVRAAERHHQLLVLALSDQAGTCDDGVWHDPAWYEGGYRVARNDDGRHLGNLSYLAYVRKITARYRNSPAIAMWEPVNEAEASTCTGATGSGCWDNAHRSCDDAVAGPALRSFFDTIGGVIRRSDPNHLISSGLAGGLECGVDGGWHSYIAASPGIDVLSYHDQGAPADVLPHWLDVRLHELTALHKPLFVGEAGLNSCDVDRPRVAAAKLAAAFGDGAVGWLSWSWSASPAPCADDVGPGDPELAVLRSAPRR